MNIETLLERLLATISPEWFLSYLAELEALPDSGPKIKEALLEILSGELPSDCYSDLGNSRHNTRAIHTEAIARLRPSLGEKKTAECFVQYLFSPWDTGNLHRRKARTREEFLAVKKELVQLSSNALLECADYDSVYLALKKAAEMHTKPQRAAAAFVQICEIARSENTLSKQEQYLDLVKEGLVRENQQPTGSEFWAYAALGGLVEHVAIYPMVIAATGHNTTRIRHLAVTSLHPVTHIPEVRKALWDELLGTSSSFSDEQLRCSLIRKSCLNSLREVTPGEEFDQKLMEALFAESCGSCCKEVLEYFRGSAWFRDTVTRRLANHTGPISKEVLSELPRFLPNTAVATILELLNSSNLSVQQVGISLIVENVSSAPDLEALLGFAEKCENSDLRIAICLRCFDIRTIPVMVDRPENLSLRKILERSVSFMISLFESDDPELFTRALCCTGACAELACKLALNGKSSDLFETGIKSFCLVATSQRAAEQIDLVMKILVKLEEDLSGNFKRHRQIADVFCSIALDNSRAAEVRLKALENICFIVARFKNYLCPHTVAAIKSCFSKVIADENKEITLAAIRLIPRQQSVEGPEAIARLWEMLSHPDRGIEEKAFTMLKEAMPGFLLIAANDEREELAAKALNELERRGPPPENLFKAASDNSLLAASSA